MRRASQTHKESTASTRVQPRARDDKKVTVEATNKPKCPSSTPDETMEPSKGPTEDVYEFKTVKESEGATSEAKAPPASSSTTPATPSVPESAEEPPESAETQGAATPTAPADEGVAKRAFSEVSESGEEAEDESKRKKRKEEAAPAKEGCGKTATPRGGAPNKNQGGGKQAVVNQAKVTVSSGVAADKGGGKSPCSSPKPGSSSDAELEDGKSDLKVPPLKIVIPQSSASEPEPGGTSRNGKSSSQRAHQALPYVVPSSNSGGDSSVDKEPGSGNASPEGSTGNGKSEDKKEGSGVAQTEDQRGSSHQRVLRSSHRSGPAQGTDRGSNNSSPQLQRSHSPSPSASPAAPAQTEIATSASATVNTVSKTTDSQASGSNDSETNTTPSTSTASSALPAPVELHPRKRKMKPSKELTAPPAEPAEPPVEAQVHPHDQPITNCYQLYLNIRKQIDKRRRGLFPVQPKPPQGFKDYLMNRCTYVLASNAPTTPNITYPPSLPAQMKDLFTDQEKERYRLRMQHVIEKEKLVLSVEQEILRVHGRAARALANQSLPFSVCTILRDEEVYNLITPEQEEKDRNARSRYNGRLFLSWLQDVDDKWEKIKEHMLLRHHNEAESLHAVQKMDWEWKMKEMSLCDRKSTPSIDEHHVPMVHVSDDFDLLPA